MRALLDINVIIALLDSNHTFNTRAHAWWKTKKKVSWASCPLTENGVLRIMCGTGYDPVWKYPLLQITSQFRVFTEMTDHEFWDDNISVLDDSIFALNQIYSSRHLTDSYLLGLATVNNGYFVTLDRGVVLTSVKNATTDNLIVI